MNHTDFYVLDNDKKVMKVTIASNAAAIEHYKEVKIEEVTAFLESRCFDKSRRDKDDLLSYLGLTSYDVWEIVRKTNGKMAHDHLSIEFV